MLSLFKSAMFKNGIEKEMYSSLEEDTRKLKNRLEVSLDNLSEGLIQIKNYQKEIEDARDFWKMTFDAVEAPLAILDSDSKIIKANKAFVEATEIRYQDLKGEIICKVFCKADEDQYSPCKECCAQEYIYKNNRLYKIKFNKILDLEGKLRGCVFVAHDITEEQRIQEYLSEMTSKYMSIFRTAYDAIILCEVESKKIIEANPSASRIYGYRINDFVGMLVTDLSAEPERTKEALETKQTTIPLRFHKRKDGTIVPVEISASYYDHEGKLYCVSIIRDISDKISNEALNQCLQKLLLS